MFLLWRYSPGRYGSALHTLQVMSCTAEVTDAQWSSIASLSFDYCQPAGALWACRKHFCSDHLRDTSRVNYPSHSCWWQVSWNLLANGAQARCVDCRSHYLLRCTLSTHFGLYCESRFHCMFRPLKVNDKFTIHAVTHGRIVPMN